mmetsp:Transcript_2372/g.6735  ORF Transcript_2372/g.6735 Transcript_2372/m.6735 type:complete len:154 (-) Transcript_2372:772-1233(-)
MGHKAPERCVCIVGHVGQVLASSQSTYTGAKPWCPVTDGWKRVLELVRDAHTRAELLHTDLLAAHKVDPTMSQDLEMQHTMRVDGNFTLVRVYYSTGCALLAVGPLSVHQRTTGHNVGEEAKRARRRRTSFTRVPTTTRWLEGADRCATALCE